MDILLTLATVVLLLFAIAPVLMAGGSCIAAFMLQKDILKHLMLTLGTIVALLLCALLVTGALAAQASLVKAIVFALPIWGTYHLLKRVIFR